MGNKLSLFFLVMTGAAGRAWGELCNSAFDGIFVADESSSIGQQRYSDDVIPALKQFVNDFDVSPQTARLCLMSFSDENRVAVSFSDPASTNQAGLLKAISNMDKTYANRGTNALEALREIKNVQWPLHKKRNPQVPLIITFFTDGYTMNADETIQIANSMRAADPSVTFVCFGVSNYDIYFMKRLCRDDALIFAASDFSEMSSVIKLITDKVCKVADTKKPTPAPVKPVTRKPTITSNPTSTTSPTTAETPPLVKFSPSPTVSPTSGSNDLWWLTVLIPILLAVCLCAECAKRNKAKKLKKDNTTEKSSLKGAQGAAGFNFYGDIARGWTEQALVPGVTLTGTPEQQAAQLKAHQQAVNKVKANYASGPMIVPSAKLAKSWKNMTTAEIFQSIVDNTNKGMCPGCGCKRRAARKPAAEKPSELKKAFKAQEKKKQSKPSAISSANKKPAVDSSKTQSELDKAFAKLKPAKKNPSAKR